MATTPVDNLARLTNRPPRTESITLALDPNDATRLAEARRERDATKSSADRLRTLATADPDDNAVAARSAAAAKAERAARKVYDGLVSSTVTFTVHLRSVPVPVIEQLRLDHRPTDAQRKAARSLANGDPKADPLYNPDSFPPAFVAAALDRIEFSDDPDHPVTDLTAEQVHDMVAGWSDTDREMVLSLADMLSTAPSSVGDLGKD